jgi:hypothetical protein
MAIELHTDYSVNRTGFSMNVKIGTGFYAHTCKIQYIELAPL